MIIRTGFVSNSSSSSFAVIYTIKDLSLFMEQVKNVFNVNLENMHQLEDKAKICRSDFVYTSPAGLDIVEFMKASFNKDVFNPTIQDIESYGQTLRDIDCSDVEHRKKVMSEIGHKDLLIEVTYSSEYGHGIASEKAKKVESYFTSLEREVEFYDID